MKSVHTHLGIIKSMFDFLSVHIYAIVVVFGIHYKSTPFSPAWWYIGTIVFIQIFTKITGPIAGIRQIGSEGTSLMRRLPLGTGTIVIVREYHMIVNIHAG